MSYMQVIHIRESLNGHLQKKNIWQIFAKQTQVDVEKHKPLCENKFKAKDCYTLSRKYRNLEYFRLELSGAQACCRFATKLKLNENFTSPFIDNPLSMTPPSHAPYIINY